MRKCAAEFFGTFCLVFAGTGAIVVDELSAGAVTHAGVALTFGLVVLAMIYTVGDISGAHLNPAVTIGFFAAGRFDAAWVLPYLASQILGAVSASGLLYLLFPQSSTFGMTVPAGPVLQSFGLEIVLSAMLMWVILSVSIGAKEKGITAGIAIGSIIALEALFAGPICGASMNPARSLAPALVAMQFQSLWIYLSAPVLGALVAIPICSCLRPACCTWPSLRRKTLVVSDAPL